MTVMTLTILILVVVTAGAFSKAKETLEVAGMNLGKDVTSMIEEATKLLGGIRDLDSILSKIRNLR
jgi:hypothetical protein